MDETQFNQQIEGLNEERDVAVRETHGGFVVTGTRRFLNPATGILAMQFSYDAVAMDTSYVASMIEKFLTSGKLV